MLPVSVIVQNWTGFMALAHSQYSYTSYSTLPRGPRVGLDLFSTSNSSDGLAIIYSRWLNSAGYVPIPETTDFQGSSDCTMNSIYNYNQ